jgi:hypothetical protein
MFSFWYFTYDAFGIIKYNVYVFVFFLWSENWIAIKFFSIQPGSGNLIKNIVAWNGWLGVARMIASLWVECMTIDDWGVSP